MCLFRLSVPGKWGSRPLTAGLSRAILYGSERFLPGLDAVCILELHFFIASVLGNVSVILWLRTPLKKFRAFPVCRPLFRHCVAVPWLVWVFVLLFFACAALMPSSSSHRHHR